MNAFEKFKGSQFALNRESLKEVKGGTTCLIRAQLEDGNILPISGSCPGSPGECTVWGLQNCEALQVSACRVDCW